MPVVSVIVPSYNHAPYLQQRIDSVLCQTFQDFELILLDDCSTDNSREVMERYHNDPHVSHILFNNQNSGSAFRQWKKGIDLAEGEWIWIAESDDWAENTFLEEMLQAVKRDPQCVLASSTPCYVFPDGKTWHKEVDGETRVYQGYDFARQRLVEGNSLPNVSALLIRCDVMRQLGFDEVENMRLCGDWLLYAMLCAKGNVVELGKVLSSFRQHGDNTSVEAEKNGLSLTEGVRVLNYLCQTFHVPSKAYARSWGRTWAKLERKYHYGKTLRNEIRLAMRRHASISFWHQLYKIKLAL